MLWQSLMAEALRQTRSADLIGSRALIRTMLDRSVVSPRVEASGSDVIDRQPKRVTVEPREGEPAHNSGRFEMRLHDGPAGRLEYMLYRPVAAAPGLPLVTMLHGCIQSPEDFALGTGMNRLADELGFLVAYPRQTPAANQQRCWNWYRSGDQERGHGEPALVAGVTRDVIEAEGADAARVYVAGFSAGGATAAIMAEAYPDLFAAVGVHSGVACGVARDLPTALSAMARGAGTGTKRRKVNRFVPLITFHGDRDGTVNEINARELVVAAMAATGVSVEVDVETGKKGGRSYACASRRDAAGKVLIKQWTIAGAGHAWSGGHPGGSYADAKGPNASREMLRFFFEQRLAGV